MMEWPVPRFDSQDCDGVRFQTSIFPERLGGNRNINVCHSEIDQSLGNETAVS